MAALTTLVGAGGRMAALGVIVFPIAAAGRCSATTAMGTCWRDRLDWRLQLHAWLALLAYATLAIAALLAVMLWVQERALRRREFHGWLRALPPLIELETLLFRTIAVGFALLTATLLTGVLFVENLFAQHLVHKTVLSVLSWLRVRRAAAGSLALRLARRHGGALDAGRDGAADAGLLRQQVRPRTGPAPARLSPIQSLSHPRHGGFPLLKQYLH